MNTLINALTDQNLTTEFQALAQKIVEHTKRAGAIVVAYRSEDVPHFAKLDSVKKREVLDDLRGVVEVYRMVEADGFSLKDSAKLLWRILSRLRLAPCTDIFDKIGDDDVVSVFSPDHTHLFYNLRFMELVNFTIEELYCSEWYTLTRREEWAQKALHEAATAVFTGQIRETFHPNVARHHAEDTTQNGITKFWIDVKYLSPVRRENQVAGVIVVYQMTPV